MQDFNKAIEINSYYAIAYYNRSVANYNLGDEASACFDWSKAGELGYYDVYDLIREYCN